MKIKLFCWSWKPNIWFYCLNVHCTVFYRLIWQYSLRRFAYSGSILFLEIFTEVCKNLCIFILWFYLFVQFLMYMEFFGVSAFLDIPKFASSESLVITDSQLRAALGDLRYICIHQELQYYCYCCWIFPKWGPFWILSVFFSVRQIIGICLGILNDIWMSCFVFKL